MRTSEPRKYILLTSTRQKEKVMSVYTSYKPNQTPQTEKISSTQIKNNAGGYVFKTSSWDQFRRFLTLGTEGGTFYVSGQKLTKENAENITRVLSEFGTKAVDEIVTVSVEGQAPKVQPQLFALAVAASHKDIEVRQAAFDALPKVCRTFTHLAEFTEMVKNFRSIGTGLQKAIARWYTSKPVDSVAYQAVKYRNREGWTHRDMLRVSHPKTDEEDRKNLFDYICGREIDPERLPDVVRGFEAAQRAESVTDVTSVLAQSRLPWETVPTNFHNQATVWETIIDQGQLGLTALIRQLPRLTNLKVTETRFKEIKALLQNEDQLKRARVHPITILNAMIAYKSGTTRSGVNYSPSARIIDLLDDAFYASVGFVEPTGKRVCLALDVSGSMDFFGISGMSLTPRDASAALAMITAKTEQDYKVMAFTREFQELSISPRQRLDDVIRTVSNRSFGGTDCSLPMRWAQANNEQFDAFVVYTDNETWAGYSHPVEALRDYRRTSGINDAKLVVVGMTATECSIADPSDPNMLDVAGFNTTTPDVISNFIKGEQS